MQTQSCWLILFSSIELANGLVEWVIYSHLIFLKK